MASGLLGAVGTRPVGRGSHGQSTVEYLVVLSAFVAMLGALGLMWHLAEGGTLSELARQSAPYSLEQGFVAALKDILCF